MTICSGKKKTTAGSFSAKRYPLSFSKSPTSYLYQPFKTSFSSSSVCLYTQPQFSSHTPRSPFRTTSSPVLPYLSSSSSSRRIISNLLSMLTSMLISHRRRMEIRLPPWLRSMIRMSTGLEPSSIGNRRMQNEDFVPGAYGRIQGTLTLLVNKHSGYVLCIFSKSTELSLVLDYHIRHPVIHPRSSLFDLARPFSNKGPFGTQRTNCRRPGSDQELHHALLPHLTRSISLSPLLGLDTLHGVHQCQ